jgi:N-acetylmuramoyl-L-alanine amidase
MTTGGKRVLPMKPKTKTPVLLFALAAIMASGCSTGPDRAELDRRGAIPLTELASELGLAVESTRFPEDRTLRTEDGRSFYLMADRRHYRYEGDAYEVGDQAAFLVGGELLIPQGLASRIRSHLDDSPPPQALREPDRPRLPTPAAAKNSIIMLDPGHGGKDPGAVVGKSQEKTVALSVSQAVAANLRKRGFTVHETRSTDQFIELDERVAAAARRGAGLFVSIHANAASNRKARGVEVFYPNENSPRAATAERLASRMSTRIAAVQGQPNRGAKRDPRGLRVLRGTRMPAVLVELGFMTNPEDLKLLNDAGWRTRAAAAIADEIAAEFRNP